MDRGLDGGWLPPVARRLEAGFDVREVCIGPGGERAYDVADWRGALVVVARGTIELEWLTGARCRFVAGDLLCLSGLGLRLLRNPGHAPVVLSATSRRRKRP